METLLDLFPNIRRLGNREAIRFFNGFRTWKLSYRELYGRIGGFVRYLDEKGFRKGDRVLLWGESGTEWVVVFWGCLARGVQIVPVDARFSVQLVLRIQKEVQPRLLVHGESVRAHDLPIERVSFDEIRGLAPADQIEIANISPADVVEIVYTSGTTGEPKGVVHRHKNICANLRPIQREIGRYRKLAIPFQPVRILNMLPLSHMFGQSLGLFIPLLLEGSAVFMKELQPAAMIETIRRERVSVLVSVPRLLTNLQHEIERRFELPNGSVRKGVLGIPQRWWRFRKVHAAFGWKFWSVVVGGARVDPELEEFWSRLGFLVVQGYGMTETSPVVAMNHPFNARQGSLGKVAEGLEVRLAPDGEILVRGESVVSEYLGAPEGAEAAVEEGGWLHTGDIGAFDEEGRLYYKGRKKDVIVTADGLNVHPQDVEAVLNKLPEVQESTVIGLQKDGEEQVHAVLIFKDTSANVEELIGKANRQLEAYQRIRSWSLWPEDDFPRTASTLKIKRGDVASRIAGAASKIPRQKPEAAGVEGILARMTGRETSALGPRARLSEDLGLSSLERVDLLSELEDLYGIELGEETFAELATVGDLKEWIAQAPKKEKQKRDREAAQPVRLPRWARTFPFRWAGLAVLHTVVLPLFRHYIELTVEGLVNLEKGSGPVIFAANHASHLDTPAILASLPFNWRRRVTPAMEQEYFRAYFEPRGFSWKERWKVWLLYHLACGVFNAYPLPHEMGGVRASLKYTGELVSLGYCPLVYPEGERTPDGNLRPFKSGIGLMATRLNVPIVPIHIRGMFDVYSIHHDWPRARPVRVRVGRPLAFTSDQTYEEVTRRVEEAIEALCVS